MFIDYIELENYRPYYGKNTINFGYTAENNFNVILAKNATGKSSLLNALTWCLYNEELHDKRNKKNEIYNKIVEKECENGETFPLKVKISFYDIDENNNKSHFSIERSRIYKKTHNGVYIDHENLCVIDFDNEPYNNEKAERKILSKIPREMNNYFFFNGETLAGYFESEGQDNLQSSVEQISQLDLLSKVSEHLDNVINSLTNDMPKIEPDSEKITNQLSELEKEIQSKKTERDGILVEMQFAKDSIKECEDELEKLKKHDPKKLIEEKEELSKKKESIEKLIKQDTESYNRQVIELYPISKLFDVLYDVSLTEIEDLKIDDIPTKYLEVIYKNIISTEKCICGADLNNNHDYKNNIEKLIEGIQELKNKQDNQNKSKKNLNSIIKDIKNLILDLDITFEEINRLYKKINHNYKTLNDPDIGINHRLEELDDEIDYSIPENKDKWAQELSKAERLLSEYKDEYEKLSDKISSLNAEYEKTNEDLEKSIEGREEANKLIKQRKICADAKNIMESFTDELKSMICKKIEDNTNKQFIDTNWSDGKFEGVHITNNYEVSVIDFYGDEVIGGDLSGGEEIILALSFITALHNISGFDLPLFIDAPLSKLDNGYGEDFIKNLHKFSSKKQIVFLFTDRQYDVNVKKDISEHLNWECELIKEKNYMTRIQPHQTQFLTKIGVDVNGK